MSEKFAVALSPADIVVLTYVFVNPLALKFILKFKHLFNILEDIKYFQ